MGDRKEENSEVTEQLGTPLTASGPDPIRKTSREQPGFGWRLSDDARRDIEEIEENARMSELNCGAFALR